MLYVCIRKVYALFYAQFHFHWTRAAYLRLHQEIGSGLRIGSFIIWLWQPPHTKCLFCASRLLCAYLYHLIEF